MINVTFLPSKKTVSVEEGSLLHKAALSAGVSVETPCGGKGVCGKCLVRVLSGDVDFKDGWQISKDLRELGYILICTSRVKNTDVHIQTFSDISSEEGSFSDKIIDFENISPDLKPKDVTDYIVKTIKLSVALPQVGDGLSDYDRLVSAIENELGGDVSGPISVVKKLPEVLREK